jgi:hypothetical protein
MVTQSSTEPVFPVGFDDDALAVDLAHLPASADLALRLFRKAIRRQGRIPRARDGSRLGGCVKTRGIRRGHASEPPDAPPPGTPSPLSDWRTAWRTGDGRGLGVLST